MTRPSLFHWWRLEDFAPGQLEGVQVVDEDAEDNEITI